MINFIKKHKLNFISYFLCAFAMALFTIISFSCKTYAYTIDNNGNLVGSNLLDLSNYSFIENASVSNQQITFLTSNNTSGDIRIGLGTRTTINTWLLIGINDDDNRYQYATFNIDSNNYQLYFRFNGNSQDGNVYYNLDTFNNGTYTLSFNFDYSPSNTIILQTMLNQGATAEEWEPYGVWYSKANYDNLQEQYNGLYDSQITNTIQYAFNGATAKLYDGTISTPLEQQTPLVQGTLSVDSSYLVTSGDSSAISDYFENIDYDVVDYPLYTYYIKPNIVINNSFLIQVFDLTFDYDFTLYYSDGTSQVYNASSLTPPRYTIVVNENRKDILYLTFDLYLPDYAYIEMQMTIDGVSYNTGYTTGYNDGYNWGNSNGYSNGYQNKVSSYENQINSLNNSINTLKDLNSQLREQIDDNLGWSSLFFAFADTPFKVVSNVLGFELFGLNLFATFIGMITVFGVVYLLKKFI